MTTKQKHSVFTDESEKSIHISDKPTDNWPFPKWPNLKDPGANAGKLPKFNSDNIEDSPL